MANPKRHLLRRMSRANYVWAACGLRNPRMWTEDPREVTCNGCRRTVEMADAEVAQQLRHRGSIK